MLPRALLITTIALSQPLMAFAQGGDIESIVNAVPHTGGMFIIAILWNIESKRRAEETKQMLSVIQELSKGPSKVVHHD